MRRAERKRDPPQHARGFSVKPVGQAKALEDVGSKRSRAGPRVYGVTKEVVPGPGKVLFQAANANLNPWTEDKVDTRC